MNNLKVRAMVASVVGILVLTACGGGEPAPSAFPGMLVDGKSATVTSNTLVHRYDVTNGAELWHFPVSQTNGDPRGPFSGVPVKVGNTIVVGGSTGTNGAYDRNLYGLSEENGQEIWRFSPSDKAKEFAAGAVSDGKLIYAPNGDGNLYAIQPPQEANSTPTVAWTFTTGNKLWGLPLLANGKLYQGGMDHKLYAIDAATGKEVWRFTEATAPIAAEPVMKDGVLYFGAFDSFFYAVNAADGKLKWKTAVEGWVWATATLSDDSIYLADVTGKLYALDLATGQRKWYFEARDTIKAQPVISNNILYVVSVDTLVYAFDVTNIQKDATGKVDSATAKWRNETLGRRLLSSPALVDNLLLVPIFDGDVKVWALDTNTGSRKYQFPPLPTPTPAGK